MNFPSGPLKLLLAQILGIPVPQPVGKGAPSVTYLTAVGVAVGWGVLVGLGVGISVGSGVSVGVAA